MCSAVLEARRQRPHGVASPTKKRGKFSKISDRYVNLVPFTGLTSEKQALTGLRAALFLSFLKVIQSLQGLRAT